MTSDLRTALLEARELARVERFLAVVDAAAGPSASHSFLAALAPIFRIWQRALREGDPAGAKDAAQLASSTLEACRRAVLERDLAIRPYRVRWACDHEPLGSPGLPRLLRFYRLLPYSPPTQSKYEFVLTRVFAGPLRPRRTLVAPHEALVERLMAMERAWDARPVVLEEHEIQAITRDLADFAWEAGECVELGELVGEGLFQRTGRYKAALGEKLYAPRVSLAAVACAVALGNAFCELLAREEGRELEGVVAGLSQATPEPPIVSLEEVAPGMDAPADEHALEQMERLERLLATDLAVEPAVVESGETTAPPVAEEAAVTGPASLEAAPAGPEAAPPVPAALAGPPAEEAPPLPSPRAAELGRQTANASVIAAYLRPPRSAEVYHLELDLLLGPLPADVAARLGPADAERRRALELILLADDLGWEREEAGGSPSDEYRARVKAAAREMTALGSVLRGLRAKAQRDAPGAARSLLYVSDHLLWERLRLEARARRMARARPRISLAPQARSRAGSRQGKLALSPRRRVLLTASAAVVVLAIAFLSRTLAEPMPVNVEVRVLDVKTLPGSEHVHDARVRRSALFVTVRLSWLQLSENARREHVRAIGRFGSGRGISAVTVADRTGQPVASFGDGAAMLAGDPPNETTSAPR